MNKKDYLNRLMELKAFIKTNPEFKKIYSDIHMDWQITHAKYEIMMDEETNDIFTDGDGWVHLDSSPFGMT